MSELKERPRWVHKFKELFKAMDTDKNGCLTRDDWLITADRLMEKTGRASNDPKGDLSSRRLCTS